MSTYKGIIILGVIALLVGCVSQPIKKSSDYTVRYIPSEKIDRREGTFVLVRKVDGKYQVHRVNNAFSGDFKDEYSGDVVTDGILWVHGSTVSPYLYTPSRRGHGQYDSEKKTFICFKALIDTTPRGHKHPHPCWSPFVKYDNPLEYISSHERKIKEIDFDEIVRSIEESQLFSKLADTNIGKIDQNSMSYLKVKYKKTAAVIQVDDYTVKPNDEILELTPGDHSITMHCMLNPRGHGPEKGKRVVKGSYELEAGYLNYVDDGRGIAVVGIVCKPQLKTKHCRHAGSRCKKSQ